jgi:hypothetical protein
MKEFLQMLKDAFPFVATHPVLFARFALLALLLVGLYRAKELRKRICEPVRAKLWNRIIFTNRWLFVYRDPLSLDDWKYYTSESTGKGAAGDDVVWTLVHWPSLRPQDTFTVPGAVGLLDGVHQSEARLRARWKIEHHPDRFIGSVPARGLMSKLRRASAKALEILASI